MILPEGLVVGWRSGTIPDGWQSYTAADGKFLFGVGEDNSPTPGSSTAASNSGSYSTAESGAHAPGTTGFFHWLSLSFHTTSGSPFYYSSGETAGSHTHSGTLTYTPDSNRFQLIQATENLAAPDNLILFALGSIQGHSLVSCSPRLTVAGSGDYTQSAALGETSSSGEHKHTIQPPLRVNASGGGPTVTVSDVGLEDLHGAHTHTPTLSSASLNLLRVSVRAYSAVAGLGFRGLIGMWPYTDVPVGWQVVASLAGKYLETSSTGNGEPLGDGSAVFSMTFTTASHSHHPDRPPPDYDTVYHGLVRHTAQISHTHSCTYNFTNFQLPRFNIKFIEYMG